MNTVSVLMSGRNDNVELLLGKLRQKSVLSTAVVRHQNMNCGPEVVPRIWMRVESVAAAACKNLGVPFSNFYRVLISMHVGSKVKAGHT